MSLNLNKKGATELRGLKFLIAAFGIVFILITFYIWVGKEVASAAREQAEVVASDIDLRMMYSDIIRKHGIEIAKGDEDKVEDILEEYGKKRPIKQKLGYEADCDQDGIDKACELTIILHDDLRTIATWTAFGSLALLPSPVSIYLIALKLMLSLDLKTVMHESYLPLQPGKASHFTLTTVVQAA